MKIKVSFINSAITSFGTREVESESIEKLKADIETKGNYKLSELSFEEVK